MSATATHDTKRGEDVRARLNVLSEIPDEWHEQVRTWMELNRSYKTKNKNFAMPDRNDEYLIYQTLVGAFPFDQSEIESFRDRVKDYVVKAIREAKVYTAWLRPNQAYEDACTRFVTSIFDPSDQNRFLQTFLPFQKHVAYYGIFNSLSQTLLKIASPGIPDFYQGTELWEFSLVDPDNRRPVDFEQRQSYLKTLHQGINTDVLKLIGELLSNKEDGRIKLFLTIQTLKARTRYLDVFNQGDYFPLEVGGKFKEHIVAFARRFEDTTLVAVTPRFLTSVIQPGKYPLGEDIWADTYLQLPSNVASSWKDTITDQAIQFDETVKVGEVLKYFPVAL